MVSGGTIPRRTLKSPLTEPFTLTACCQVNAPIRLLVAAPGADGEISPDDLALYSARGRGIQP